MKELRAFILPALAGLLPPVQVRGASQPGFSDVFVSVMVARRSAMRPRILSNSPFVRFWRHAIAANAIVILLAAVAQAQESPSPPRTGTDTKNAKGTASTTGKSADSRKFVVNGSIFYPTYIAEGTVYTRGVSNMPLAANSAEIAKYMPTMPSQFNKMGIVTALNHCFYNLPIYIVDSRDPSTPRVTVRYPDFRRPSPKMKQILFSDNIPLPSWAKAANPQGGGDSALAIYDIGTDIIREYFLMKKNDDGSWTASWAGYYEHMSSLARDNYACQHTEGSDFVVAMIGGPSQIGIEEARRGEIRHAVGFTIANARAGVTSWPAKQNDGKDPNPNAPAQGQWFRLPPTLNIESLRLRPFTKLIAKAAQNYGGLATDKNLWCHAFNAEPGFVEKHKTGIDPWEKGGDLQKKYNDFNINDFPWHLTEWAPIDWGKPQQAGKGNFR